MENSFKKYMPWRIKIIITITLVFILLPTSFNVYANQGVYISEVNFAGSTRPDCKLCSYDKWIELYNPSQQAIDVSFWTLRFRESQDATNNLKFPPNTFIQAKSNYLVRNRYNGLTSTLSTANIQTDAISGKVLRVSSNTTGQRRVQASLLNSSGLKISEFNLNELEISKLENEASLTSNSKFSLEFNPNNSTYKISEKTYFSGNYGSPKFGSGALVDLDKASEVQVQPVVSPVINLTPESSTVNIVQPEIKVEVPSSVASQIPAQAPALQPVNIVSQVAQQTAPQMVSQNTLQVASQINVEITPSATPQTVPQAPPQNISQANVLQNPQAAHLVTSEVSPKISTQTTSQSAQLIIPTVQRNITKNYFPTIPSNHKLKLSEIAIPQTIITQISADKELLHDNIVQSTKFFYSTLEDKADINLWPLVLLMLASIAYKKSKTYLKPISFVNILTKNLSMASN
jgi:hypothetical protein